MISDEITSGELYFQLFASHEEEAKIKSDGSRSDIKLSSQLRSYLRRKEEMDSNMSSVRYNVIKAFLSKVDSLEKSMLPVIKSRVNTHLLRVYREKMLFKNMLAQNQQRFDHSALQSILQYAAILQEEIQEANRSLSQERAMKDSLKEQARTSRNLLLFTEHLKLETKSKLQLIALQSNTAQFVRCVKAVYDNLQNIFGVDNQSPLIPTAENVTIINIFKLKNSFLAKNLQVRKPPFAA